MISKLDSLVVDVVIETSSWDFSTLLSNLQNLQKNYEKALQNADPSKISELHKRLARDLSYSSC